MQLNNSRSTDSIIAEVMPGWNGNESIVGYIIRQRREAEAAKAEAARRRKHRTESILIIANLILWPLAAGLTVHLTQLAIAP